jgi:hypothetical protein
MPSQPGMETVNVDPENLSPTQKKLYDDLVGTYGVVDV